jgi:phosphatidylinositol glycan class H protein
MRRSRPLPDSYPEFSILQYPGFREYRVENWRLARDGSGVVRNTSRLRWRDAFTVTLLSLVWPWVGVSLGFPPAINTNKVSVPRQ